MRELGKVTLLCGQQIKKKQYTIPSINGYSMEMESTLLAGSVQKTVSTSGNSMKEEWIEENVDETFTWTW